MNGAELELQIGATRAFILADAEEIVLWRRGKVSDGAGGFTLSPPVPLAPQTSRLIPQSDMVLEIEDSNGRMAVPEWVIMMEPGSDLERYDQFEWRGLNWEISQVHMKPDYEMKGDVVRVG